VTAAIVLLVGIGAVLLPEKPEAEPSPQPKLPDTVMVAGGPHPTPDGGREQLPGFRISACEVTIGEYRKFLRVLERLDPGERDVFDLEGQPEGKSGHKPDDWEAMLTAAKNGGTWRGRPIDLFHPIVNIDWWDAAAYCNWKGCRMPTQEEWFAALRDGTSEPAALKPAPWGPVTGIGADDTTVNGLRGMAGSVAEWTRRPSTNPANPLGEKQFVIIGGSHRRPARGALSREWTSDRLQRRPDLGFRVVSTAE
jgi:formylglycine-generating enzyme required for sulfatase activity